MPLETASFPPDLNTSNPPASDGLAQGDDHLRLLKSVLKNALPNITEAITATAAALNAVAAKVFPLGSSDIASAAITYVKLQATSATDVLLGRKTAGAGTVEEIACTAAGRALIAGADAPTQRTTLGLATVANTGAYSDLSGKPTLGTAAALDVGTAASKVVQLDGSAKLPAVDGSALTNLAYANVTGKDFAQLAQVVASTQASIAFTSLINSTYREYLFILESVLPVTASTQLIMELSDDGGATWKSSLYNSAVLNASGSSAGATNLTSAVPISAAADVANGAGYGVSGEVRLFSPASSSVRKRVNTSTGYHTAGAAEITVHGTTIWDSSNVAMTAVRFRFSSGNVASGTITMYGVR